MREAWDSAERVGEAGVWEEVCVQSIFLLGRRTFGEEVNNAGDLTLLFIGIISRRTWIHDGIVLFAAILQKRAIWMTQS